MSLNRFKNCNAILFKKICHFASIQFMSRESVIVPTWILWVFDNNNIYKSATGINFIFTKKKKIRKIKPSYLFSFNDILTFILVIFFQFYIES